MMSSLRCTETRVDEMTTDGPGKTAGFSLVEIMIVVSIIAVLVSIATNTFYGIVRRSKASEAFANLGTIRTGQEAYRSEHDVYLAAGPWPAATPPAQGILWETLAVQENTGFKSIGVAVDGVVRYSYKVTVAAATPYYHTTIAAGDLDDDNLDAVYIVSNDPNEARVNAAGETPSSVYPKVILDDAGDDF